MSLRKQLLFTTRKLKRVLIRQVNFRSSDNTLSGMEIDRAPKFYIYGRIRTQTKLLAFMTFCILALKKRITNIYK